MKKKCNCWSIFLHYPNRNIAHVMLFILMFFTSNMIVASSTLEMRLSLRQNTKTLFDVIKEIEKKSEFVFVYSNNIIPKLKKPIAVNTEEKSIKEILQTAFSNSDLEYKINGNQISILQKETISKEKAVKGQILDKTGIPLIGVTVSIKGQSGGTTTDLDGNFSLKVTEKDILLISYVGYESQEIRISDISNETVKITLLEKPEILDEIVVVGYGTQRKVNLTGAVGVVDVNKQLEGRPITDIGRGIQGAVPGLSITTSSGQIGGDPTFKLRGAIGSTNSASSPLILVDNVMISNLSTINPADIESISVLKDAASASIYGARAVFGVILITTKKGKEGERFKINYSTNLSWSSPTRTPEIASSYDGAELALMSGQRVNSSLSEITNTINMVWNSETIERMREWDRVYGGYKLSPEMVIGRDFDIIDGKLQFYRSFDAADEFIKKNTFAQQHNLSINGGSDKTSYNISLGYLGQEGVMKVNSDKFDRYNASFTTSSKINKWLNVRTKALYSRTNLETPYSFSSATYDPWYYMYRWPRIMPYGTYEGIPFRNVITEMEQANTNSRTNNYLRLNVGTTIKLPLNFSLDADYTFTNTNRMMVERGGQAEGWDFWSGNGLTNKIWTSSSANKIKKINDQSDLHTFNIIGRWNNTLSKDHEISAFAGTNIEYYNNYGVSGERRDLVLLDVPEFNLATGEQFATGYEGQWATAGFFARINYVYKKRYLLELNGRYDGSSRFPLDQMWGFFPSFSMGYIITEEDFMERVRSWMNHAKIRFSWGQIGNDKVADYMYLPIMASTGSGWIIDNTIEKTFGLPKTISKGFTWETVTTTNLGFDSRLFNDKMGISFDIFKRVTSDMITGATSVPSTYGASAPLVNFGELTTRGWELALDFRHKFSNDLVLNLRGTLADNRITISKYPSGSKLLSSTYYEGQRYGEIWGFETDRFFTQDDFITDPKGNLILKEGIATQEYFETSSWFRYGPGDIKYKDLNGDGKIDRGKNTVADPGDQKVIGNSTPRYEYGGRIGVEWKGFDLDIYLQGVGKREMWGNGSIFIPGYNYTEAWYTHQLDYWTPENPDAFYPRISNLAQSNNSQNFLKQTKYLLDMSYCRLKNMALGYSIPSRILKKVNLERLRVYVSFENLFEIHNLGNIPIDPETAISTGDGNYLGRSYPYTRTASFGIQITL